MTGTDGKIRSWGGTCTACGGPVPGEHPDSCRPAILASGVGLVPGSEYELPGAGEPGHPHAAYHRGVMEPGVCQCHLGIDHNLTPSGAVVTAPRQAG